jgi:ribosomal protein S18 acetylase RimI-like enzyme
VSTEHLITRVGEEDLDELLPLLRGYCDFYEVSPSDEALLAVSRALIADPEREGVQLIARGAGGDAVNKAVGFATIYWTWQTLNAARLAVMNDLFIAREARGSGLAERLIAACRERAAEHGACELTWQTAKDNHRAQAVYDRVGGTRSEWYDYSLAVPQD